MNKQCFEMLGVTYKNYADWCKRMNVKENKNSSIKRFFNDIKNGKIVKDLRKDKLIIKRNEVK